MALASAERTRARVAWSGHPARYWLTTGAGLGALSYAMLLPGWWDLAIPAALGMLVFMVFAGTGLTMGGRRCRAGGNTRP